MSKVNNSSASRFFYSFGTVFLFAVLTICIINFSRDGRLFNRTVPTVSAETAVSTTTAPEVTIKIDTSNPKSSSGSSSGKHTKPAGQSKTPDTGNTGGSGVQPANPGEEP